MVFGESTVTVRAAVMTEPRIAVAPAALGEPLVQLLTADQTPLAFFFQVELPPAAAVTTRSIAVAPVSSTRS